LDFGPVFFEAALDLAALVLAAAGLRFGFDSSASRS
jgi:hypothetical protein